MIEFQNLNEHDSENKFFDNFQHHHRFACNAISKQTPILALPQSHRLADFLLNAYKHVLHIGFVFVFAIFGL